MRVPLIDNDDLSVAIIGAGAGGIAMGAGLRMAGVSNFRIFEQKADVGGTWWDNHYPGAAVDTPQPFYSFTFHLADFTTNYCHRDELLHYLRNTADKFNLRPHIRFDTQITKLVWDDRSQLYEILAGDESLGRYNVVVSAVGLLNNPNYPSWPGLDAFGGRWFHSARWPDDVDIVDRRVAVVGTGSTAAQIVPAVASVVEQLYVFQRQPGWIVPKPERPFTAKERAMLLQRNSIFRRKLWWSQYMQFEKVRGTRVEGRRRNIRGETKALEYILSVFADRADLAKLVTPEYPFGGKRVIQDSNFYPALRLPNVELVPHAVQEVTPTGIIDATGTERKADIIIACTGFTAANYLATFDVLGEGGQSLHGDVWRGEPSAYLGLMVPGFPNFYILYGPNTNGAPIMILHELQCEFVLRHLRRMADRGISAIEVRPRVWELFNEIVDKRINRTVMQRSDVHNYGRAPSGRNVIAWDEGITPYAMLTRYTHRLACRASRAGDSWGSCAPPAGG